MHVRVLNSDCSIRVFSLVYRVYACTMSVPLATYICSTVCIYVCARKFLTNFVLSYIVPVQPQNGHTQDGQEGKFALQGIFN